ncbi:hypothetical protein [Pseudomonas protegens]|uniref:hypothetical protein n=1 Tax=Pseudomonas protegens TaxID=380021 RepID=UPI001A9168E7|nr:hypothetical protein [Pseudomonas protegens]
MIRTQYISRFPLNKFRHHCLDLILAALAKTQPDKSRVMITCAFYNAFIDIIGVDFHSAFTISMVHAYRGFLIEETDANRLEINRCCNTILSALPAMSISNDGYEWSYEDGEAERCVRLYISLRRDKKLLKYYSGWIAISQDGNTHFMNLCQFYSQYGYELTDRFHHCLIQFSRTYRSTTLSTKYRAINKTVTQICETFPTLTHFKILENAAEVNGFFEYFYELSLAKYLIDNPEDSNLRLFDKDWHSITIVAVEFFVMKKLIAKPLYELHRGAYSGAIATEKHNANYNEKLVKLLTPIPLQIDDDEALVLLHREIIGTLDFLLQTCKQVRLDTLENHHRRVATALRGKVSKYEDDVLDRLKFENQCATWEKYGYSIASKPERYRYFGVTGSLPKELCLIDNSTLVPFIYGAVAMEPRITATWLVDLKLVDKHDQEYGLRSDGTLALGEKARRGPARSQQDIDFSSETRQLFLDMLMLTAQARKRMREQGDDDWRYLMIGCDRGGGEPKRIRALPALNSNKYQNSALTVALEKLVANGRAPSTFSIDLVSMKSVRKTAALKVYFETGSVRKMAEALGHDHYNPELLKDYLPDQILEFFLDRWIRIFQTALIYIAVKDKPCALEALGFKTIDELLDFLRNHELKPFPEYLNVGRYGTQTISETYDPTYSQVIVPISSTLCSILITLADVVERVMQSGWQITTEVRSWYETAKFVRMSIDLHESGAIDACSPEVIQIFKESRYSPVLAKSLEQLLAINN